MTAHAALAAPSSSDALQSVDQAPTREQILRLQETMLSVQCAMPEAEHYFAPGMYGRKFAMPAGMLVVGKTHLHAHLMMVLKGKATILTEFGRQEVEAGLVHVSQPGAKRVVLAHEDCIFATVHLNPSDTQDLQEIEAAHILPEAPNLGLPTAPLAEVLR